MLRDNSSRGNLERGEQRRRAVALVIVALASQSASVGQLQIALGALQSLDRWLFIDAQDNRLCRRIDIKANHIGGLGPKFGIVALAPGLGSRKINLVLAQEAPDILNVDVLQRLR